MIFFLFNQKYVTIEARFLQISNMGGPVTLISSIILSQVVKWKSLLVQLFQEKWNDMLCWKRTKKFNFTSIRTKPSIP